MTLTLFVFDSDLIWVGLGFNLCPIPPEPNMDPMLVRSGFCLTPIPTWVGRSSDLVLIWVGLNLGLT